MDTVKDFFLGLGGLIVLLVLLVAIVIAGWKLSWFAAANATQHSIQIQKQQANGQYQIQQLGQSNQDTLRATISKDYTQLTAEGVQIASAQAAGQTGLVGTLKVEAAAQAATLCQDGSQVSSAVPYPADERAWFSANCTDGVLVPTSPYYIPSAP